MSGNVVGVVGGDGVVLGDAAEDIGIDNALEQVARMRAATLMHECARMAEIGTWSPGTVENFMANDSLEQIVDTNQGKFIVVIRRG